MLDPYKIGFTKRSNKMKKFLKIAGSILIVLALVILAIGSTGGTKAWFSSAASNSGNSITAGTIKVVTSPGSVFNLTNAKPGDWALTGSVNITNTGSLPCNLSYQILNVNGNALGDLVSPSMQDNFAPWTRYGGSLSFNAAAGVNIPMGVLTAGQTRQEVLYAVWSSTNPDGVDNTAQGLQYPFDVKWICVQQH
jgi:predicted ribosomally synthesized peptide with SipW-like signal peptide